MQAATNALFGPPRPPMSEKPRCPASCMHSSLDFFAAAAGVIDDVKIRNAEKDKITVATFIVTSLLAKGYSAAGCIAPQGDSSAMREPFSYPTTSEINTATGVTARSAVGQSRRFGHRPATSGLLRSTDIGTL